MNTRSLPSCKKQDNDAHETLPVVVEKVIDLYVSVFRKQWIYLCFQMIFRNDEEFINFSLSSILEIKHNKTDHDPDNYSQFSIS